MYVLHEQVGFSLRPSCIVHIIHTSTLIALDLPLMLALVRAIGSPSCATSLIHSALSGILMPTDCTPGFRSGLRFVLLSRISVNGPGSSSLSISSPMEQFDHLYNTVYSVFT